MTSGNAAKKKDFLVRHNFFYKKKYLLVASPNCHREIYLERTLFACDDEVKKLQKDILMITLKPLPTDDLLIIEQFINVLW